jgi:prephenate dehydrogenase
MSDAGNARVSEAEARPVIAVVGVGLIGGSFALAVRQAGYAGTIVGVSSPAAVTAALACGVIDEALPLDEAAAHAEIVYLAQPIETILQTIDIIDAYVRPGTLITDAGSTKRAIVERAAKKIKRGRFVGGHPMAGKESRGVEAAEPGLFRGRPYVLTSPDAELENWVRNIGARLVHMDAAEHDRRVALVSHLPQLMATALAPLIGDQAAVAGPAAMDMTRLALSSYDIWRDILATNVAEIDAALERYIAQLESLRASLPELESAFERASAAARRLRIPTP